jgi:hypothetical protein
MQEELCSTVKKRKGRSFELTRSYGIRVEAGKQTPNMLLAKQDV